MPRSVFNQLTHINGTTSSTAGTTNTETPSIPPRLWLIQNTSDTDTLSVSFDGGTKFLSIKAGGNFEIDVLGQTSVVLKSAGASQTYEILVASYIRD